MKHLTKRFKDHLSIQANESHPPFLHFPSPHLVQTEYPYTEVKFANSPWLYMKCKGYFIIVICSFKIKYKFPFFNKTVFWLFGAPVENPTSYANQKYKRLIFIFTKLSGDHDINIPTPWKRKWKNKAFFKLYTNQTNVNMCFTLNNQNSVKSKNHYLYPILVYIMESR